jgi:hypothetical protein
MPRLSCTQKNVTGKRPAKGGGSESSKLLGALENKNCWQIVFGDGDGLVQSDMTPINSTQLRNYNSGRLQATKWSQGI